MKVIDVMKEVFISDEYMRAGNSDYVLNVSDLSETEGFTQLVIVMEGGQCCCEDANLDVIGESPYNQKIFITTIEVHELSDYETKNGWNLDEGGALKIILNTDNKNIKYELVFYNSHNGYYAHSIKVTHYNNGQIEFDYDNDL